MEQYDYSKLRGRIKEKLGTETKYAQMLNLSTASISAKLKSIVPISLKEMDKTIEILDIPTEEIYDYFFTKKVENSSTDEEV